MPTVDSFHQSSMKSFSQVRILTQVFLPFVTKSFVNRFHLHPNKYELKPLNRTNDEDVNPLIDVFC